VDLFRTRVVMEAEILVLRQQIIMLRRGRPGRVRLLACPYRKFDPVGVRHRNG
jgi:hypothetical protein